MKKSTRFLGFGILISVLVVSFLLCSFRSVNGIHFIEGQGLKTFDQLTRLAQLKGKVVYVDVWGTRCIPCLEEFAFGRALKDTFQQEAVEYLYLAVDYGHPDDEQRWRQMATEKNLTGQHILASKELYMDTWKTVKDSVATMYLIPHYIILDKKGKIAYADAKRPSTTKELCQQLRNVLAR